jgi:signal transduction histidine kinase
MSAFAWGAVAGIALTLLLAAGAGAWAYRRFVLLERRTRHAERLAELGSLTGGLAHEIKNPLSTVQLNLQLLREDLDPANPMYGRLVSRLDTVYRETSRLREILDDFLRYAGRIELDRQPTELNGLLEELVDFFAPQSQAHRVQLRLRKHPAPVVVPVDTRLLKQAVLNLMLNAVQAMPNGGELLLSLAVPPGGRFAAIDVIDTGQGIAPDVVDQVFRAYYTTKKGGTGIGLAMAQRIVDEHGGRISVRSEVGKGTDFSILLPLR